jgi:hypothetical protein
MLTEDIRRTCRAQNDLEADVIVNKYQSLFPRFHVTAVT